MKPSKNPSYQRLLSFLLAFSLILISIAPALIAPVSVYAAGSVGTLKAFLIACSAILGTGNINPASISTLNSSAYMAEANTYTASELDSLLSSDPGIARWTAPMANNAQTVELVKGYVNEAGGDPSGLNNLGRASVGENLKATIDHYYETGEIKPSIGGQTMTDALTAACAYGAMADVAYNMDQVFTYAREHNWTDEQMTALIDSGAAFGDLEGAIGYIGDLDKTIVNGIDENTPTNLLNYVGVNDSCVTCTYKDGNNYYDCIFIFHGKPIVAKIGDNSIIARKVNGSRFSYQYWRGPVDLNQWQSGTTDQFTAGGSQYINISAPLYFSNISLFRDYVNSLSGTSTSQEFKSPDIITPYGQAQGSWTKDDQNRNVYNINITPQYNTQYNYTLPDETIINNYIQEAQNAVNNGETQEDIGQLLLDLIEQMKQAIPVPTAAPVVPDQPVPDPKPTGTPEQQAENMEIMATPQLKDKFPFCIPWDVYYAFAVLEDQREAPSFDFEIDLGPAGSHHVEIDFSEWEDIASLLRLLELLAFIIGLAIATKHLMGGTGA